MRPQTKLVLTIRRSLYCKREGAGRVGRVGSGGKCSAWFEREGQMGSLTISAWARLTAPLGPRRARRGAQLFTKRETVG